VQWNNAGAFDGLTVSGDGTLTTSTGALIITKSNGTSFGTMAFQPASSVNITGGTINGTTIGATTATTGAFTYVTASGPITGSLTAGAYSFGSLSYSDTNIFASYNTSVNSYAQVILANGSAGASASTDFVVGNDNTTASSYFGDFGMNGSAFSGTGSFGAANAVFLSSTTSDLVIGTTTNNPIRFVINGSATDAGIINTNSGLQIRVDPRVNIQTTASSVAVNIALYDEYVFTALASTLTISASIAGTPLTGDKMIFRFKDNGTAQTLTWTTSGAGSFRAVGINLPTTTVANKVTYVGCIYNTTEAFWDAVAVVTQA
jgi:hypothetical protein